MMASAVSAFEAFGSSEIYGCFQQNLLHEQTGKGKQSDFFEEREWGDYAYLCSDYDFYEAQPLMKGTPLSDHDFYQELFFKKETALSEDQQPTSNFSMMDAVQLNVVCAQTHEIQEPVKLDACQDRTQKSLNVNTPKLLGFKKEKVQSVPPTSLELLKHNICRSGQMILKSDNLNMSAHEESIPAVKSRELSTEEVMRIASAHYIQLMEQTGDDLRMLRHPFSSMLPNLTGEETKDVELAHLLLASSERISSQQYDRAIKMLIQCEEMSSNVGNPVQRVVYYFANALRERIMRKTGRLLSKAPKLCRWGIDSEENMMDALPALLATYQNLPFGRVMEFTAMQSIIDNVAAAKRVHLVDLGIQIGLPNVILMQALVQRFACPLELLTISAVGTSQEKVEATGKWLISYARTLSLPFAFKPVIVSDMKDLNRDLFEVNSEEVIAVYAPIVLNYLIIRPDCLEHLMRVLRSLTPCIMLVTEVDANHNSPSFIKRLSEALFSFSAWFDCFETCMDRDDTNRLHIESKLFSQGIRSIVAAEGRERTLRHVRIDVWRSFFTRSGFLEVELNHLALYQAGLLTNQFGWGSSCTLQMNGKALSIGWKGTPMHFVSAWKLRSSDRAAVSCLDS